MKVISFLGFNKKGYTETTYVNPDKTKKFTTAIFQEAIVEFYKPESFYLLLTKTAKEGIPENAEESTWETLRKKLEGKVNLYPVENIPEGHTTEDIWKLFEKLTNFMQQDDEVLFDITHGFRSLPILALIAVTYLRVVRNVKIVGLIYGAFDAQNRQTNETPTFDLLPIVSLLEWTTATDQFIKTGNAQALASLLTSQEPDNSTQQLADNIESIAKGLELLRPMDVMQESAKLSSHIASASENISKTIPPFAELLKRVEQDYGKFGLENGNDYINNAKSALVKQLEIIKWYYEKEQTVQALSLAREWLPSLLCYHFNIDPLNNNNRSEMELLLRSGGVDNNKISSYKQEWDLISHIKRKPLSRLWGGDPNTNLANLRNDVLHSGFRKNPKSADDVIKRTKLVIDELEQIAKVWDLI
ncbi:MAG: TIGR02221 family CRISPR-associated protein [Coleofasciculaceae cyanobacterium SM2_1_6]|nr:TIGR02221 family CRISPR-associated protein [Coleofasciculaceae cyanobacterium SM2_1_6]